jgi:hypothetical protein
VDASSDNDPGANDQSGVTPAGPAPVPFVPSQPAVPQPPLQPLMPSQAPARVPRISGPSRWPMRIAIFVGLLSLACVGGLGVAYHLYDKATAPNRSAPDVVVDNYLQASLVDRNDSGATVYTCGDQSALASFTDFRQSLVIHASSVGAVASFRWTGLMVARAGDGATVSVNIVVSTSGASSLPGESVHAWIFATINSSDWCVKSATQVS